MEKPTQNNDNSKNDHYVKPPSFFQMAKSFTKDLATYVKEGAPNVTLEDYEKRLDTCKSCEFLIEKSMRCGACGCLLEHKAKWKTADCPKKKWEKQELVKNAGEEQKEEKKENESNFYYNEDGVQIFTSPPIAPTLGQINVRTVPLDKVKNDKRQKNNNTDSSN
jgi:hypothetical protein